MATCLEVTSLGGEKEIVASSHAGACASAGARGVSARTSKTARRYRPSPWGPSGESSTNPNQSSKYDDQPKPPSAASKEQQDAACASHRLQCHELLDQGHVPMWIISIRATMDGTGRVVRLYRSPDRAGRCYQAVGMVERYQRILLGVNQENRGQDGPRGPQHLLDGMVTDRRIRTGHQRRAIAFVKE